MEIEITDYMLRKDAQSHETTGVVVTVEVNVAAQLEGDEGIQTHTVGYDAEMTTEDDLLVFDFHNTPDRSIRDERDYKATAEARDAADEFIDNELDEYERAEKDE